MKVTILTPHQCLLDTSHADGLYFPTPAGVLGILPGHAPLVAAVGTGVVVCSQGDVSGIFKVAGGLAQITEDSATLLVDVGEEACQIDVDRAKRALERAEGRLAAKELGHIDIPRAESAKARAQARLEAAERYRTGGTHTHGSLS